MKVLGIESSCDETSVAIVETGYKPLCNITRTQHEHEIFGGVVPEIAARSHIKALALLTEKCFQQSGLSLKQMDAVAATVGPGLAGALMTGSIFAKTLAQSAGLGFIAVNHLEGHIFSPLLSGYQLLPPFLALIVSGGHTQLVIVKDFGDYQLYSRTRDDAVGECFDKVARILGLGYPGGPIIEKTAAEGDPGFHDFPVPDLPDNSFSYSGLKTSVLYYTKRHDPGYISENIAHICASFQEAALRQLLNRTKQALAQTGMWTLAVVGGVSRNQRLREIFVKELPVSVVFPAPEFTSDNAAMIAGAGLFRAERGLFSPMSIGVYPSMEL